uniref:Uncharacterized protein n=1 Tax=Arundo donax TaxID=35708 RepID=A0A0A9CPI4_ARUDO
MMGGRAGRACERQGREKNDKIRFAPHRAGTYWYCSVFSPTRFFAWVRRYRQPGKGGGCRKAYVYESTRKRKVGSLNTASLARYCPWCWCYSGKSPKTTGTWQVRSRLPAQPR